jgi:hypothetical protein
MPKDAVRELQAIVDATHRHISDLQSRGLEGTAKLYAIALLDLQTKLHRISDEELDAFCQALQREDALGRENVIDFASRMTGKA